MASPVERALGAWFEGAWFEDAEVEPVVGGLINETYRVAAGGKGFALQRLSPIFDPAIMANIEAVTDHLAKKGMLTPRLVRTVSGEPYHHHDGRVWRMMSWVDGCSFDAAMSEEQVASAGQLVGRFHRALDDLQHAFVGLRLGVHDTAAHLARLEAALVAHGRHRLAGEVQALGPAILEAATRLEPLPRAPARVCHGDLKLSNVRFAGPEGESAERALCLVDLDTLGPMALAHELGDALRSWCNPRREDEAPRFEIGLMAAAAEGYRRGQGRPLAPTERQALVVGVEHVCLELAARFAADALNERYFGFDRDRYPGRGEHNLARAQSQWALYRSVLACRAEREAALDRL